MPREYLFSSDWIDNNFSSKRWPMIGRPDAESTWAPSKYLELLRALVADAGTSALGRPAFEQLLDDINTQRPFREIASREGSSPATELRRRRAQLDQLRSQFHEVRLVLMAKCLNDSLIHKGGETLEPLSGNPLLPTPVYLVSVRKHGRRWDSLPNVEQIFNWLSRKAAILGRDFGGHYLGIWRSSRMGIHCDLNRAFRDEAAAFAFGFKEKQEYIRDHLNAVDLKVSTKR